ncbi:hypothetical protein ACIQVK_10480 [Streptomyces sp. NPDC090493]
MQPRGAPDGGGDLERPIDDLVQQAWSAGGHTDDVAVLLRTRRPHA